MQERSFYKCETCGNIVGIIHDGGGELVCCGEPMAKLIPNTTDAAQEKHVPVFVREGDKIIVSVGGAPHPMAEEHGILWIAVGEPGRTQRVTLRPGGEPKAEFPVCGDEYDVYAYCNLHGLWKSRASAD